MKICIIGMGILGIAYSSILSDSDVDVIGADLDEELIEMLHEGELPAYEPGLRPLMMASLESGKLGFTNNVKKAIEESEIIFITASVPTDDDDIPDLRFIKPIAQSIGNHIKGYTTVVVKSTVPPGSCKLVKNTIQKVLDERKVDISFDVVSNPDFARKGVMIKDCLVPEMVVIGAESKKAVEKVKSVYDSLHVQEENYVITDLQSAELIKYGVNAFLAVKLSFINEMALLCENADANILDVSRGMGKDFRISPEYLEAGPGFGGSDLPKDSKALAEIAKAYGEELKVVRGAIAANSKQKDKMVEKIKRMMGDLEGKVIGILGLSYKPETTDMREAPSINIIKGLIEAGASIRIYCPEGNQEAKWRLYKEKDEITYCKDVYEAAEGADAVAIITNWREFKGMDQRKVLEAMRDRYFFDFRNLFGEEPPVDFIYSGLGVPIKKNLKDLKGNEMNYREIYSQWLKQEDLDPQLKEELDNLKDEKEIEDRFYTDLEFGTGGMRGKMGVGTNRMNVHAIARVTKGLGNYLLKKDEANRDRGVVIAYDSRNRSREFAETAACVLGKMGIKAYLFEELTPTPELSFAVRHKRAAAGIVITASHNPKEYNGYKVYGEDGGQMVTESADALIAEIGLIDGYFGIEKMSLQDGLDAKIIEMLGQEMDQAYTEAVTAICQPNPENQLKVVYTPLHGSGNKPVRRVLKKLGYEDVYIVPEQEMPDGNFPTAPYPNPEDRSVFTLAMKMAEEKQADVIIGTDPDSDRVGVVCRNSKGEFIVLTGNQTGALLVDYFLKTRKDLPENKVVIKTIVTSELGGIVAKSHGAAVLDVLTGFKYIGEYITEFEKTHEYTFAFGYEESYGYLAGDYARDKDAVIASALVCEMTDYYKKMGMTLYEALVALFEKHGYFVEDIEAIALDGIEGKAKINAIMEQFRGFEADVIAKLKIKEKMDFQSGICKDLDSGHESTIDLPKSNVLKFVFDDLSWFALRPSGTEPKLKIYFSVTGKSEAEALDKKERLKASVLEMI